MIEHVCPICAFAAEDRPTTAHLFAIIATTRRFGIDRVVAMLCEAHQTFLAEGTAAIAVNDN